MLKEVHLTSEVAAACWCHAHSTELEEVMGLLIGQIVQEEEGEEVVKFSALKVIRRLTKQKDRVEIEPNQLMAAASFAEGLEGEGGEKMRVLGWYHSHPHITVWPSHVDLQTQANYQNMDNNFVGLIFSVFNYDPNTGVDNREVTAFQSERNSNGVLKRREVPLFILSNSRNTGVTATNVLNAMSTVPVILAEEEKEEYERGTKDVDLMTVIHNQAIMTAHTTEQNRLIAGPLLDAISWNIQNSRTRILRLREMKKQLMEELSSEVDGGVVVANGIVPLANGGDAVDNAVDNGNIASTSGRYSA